MTAAALALAAPGAALGAPASCATRPPDYTGTDATVAQLVLQRQEAVDNCHAVTDRQDQAHTDAAQIHTDLTVSGGLPAAVQNFPAASSSASHVNVDNFPAVQPVSLDSTATAFVDGLGQSFHGDLWVLVGAIVGTFIFSVFLAKVWP